MAIDRDKVTQAAQKYVEKKKYDKAVLEYQKLVQADPNDARTLLKIGDLQLKMVAHEQAIATYETVGNLYAKQGWALKAIAVYKQIREIIGKHVPQLEDRYAHITPKLAELYQQLGLTSDALAALDEVATRLQRQTRDAEAIEVFQKIVTLDPTNPLPHLRLAEALSRVKDTDGAVFEFKTAAAQLAGLGRRDDALKVLERLLHHKPDAEQARIAAELYLSRGQQQDGMQALAKLQICFQANPRDLDTLALLARAFNAIGQAGKAIEVQKEMARIARDAGKMEMAREIVERLMRLAPHDDQVRRLAMGSMPVPPAPPPPAAIPHASPSSPQMREMQGPPPMPHMQQGGVGRETAPLTRPQAPPYPPPPPFSRPARPATAPAFSPQGPPPFRPPVPSGPVLSVEQGQDQPEEEIDELSYQDAENVDEQAELLEDDGQGYGDAELDGEPAAELEGGEVPGEGQGYGEIQPNEEGANVSADQNAGYGTDEPEYEQAEISAREYGDAAPGEDVGAQLAQILADAQSFKRVRLFAKAVETLRAGLEIEPRSMDVREALRDTLLESGQNEEAVYEMLAIAGLYVDALDGESAARALQDVLAIDPTNQRAIEMLQELGYEVVDESEGQEGQDTEAGDRDAYQASGDQDRLPSYDLEEIGPQDVSSNYAPERRVRPSSQRPPPMQTAVPGSDGGDGMDDGGFDNAPLPSFPLDGQEGGEDYEAFPESPQSTSPPTSPGDYPREGEPGEAADNYGTTPLVYAEGESFEDRAADTDGFPQVGQGAHAAQAGEPSDTPPSAFENNVENGMEEPAPSTSSTSPVGASGGHADLEEALEESEFFVSRGLYEDARAILADHSARYPNHPLLRERLAEIDAQLSEMRGGGSGAREKPQEDRSFDIAAGIDALDSIESVAPQAAFREENQQVDVEEVFLKFKEGVAAQISVEDSESHENLGIAYKEMGLIDDAVREFEIAARDPKRECICHFNIGMIEMERGRMTEAIDAYLRGLNAPEKEADQEKMLCYEIGAAYESMKMNREALTYFQKTMRRDPNYRDVQERVRRLAKPEVQKPTPIKAAVGADDEFDRAFDDLLGGGKS